VKSCDAFVFLDNVQYIKNGWINRNSILLNGEKKYFSLPVEKGSSHTLIRDKKISARHYDHFYKKFYKTLQQEYSSSPYYDVTCQIIKNVINSNCHLIAEVAEKSIKLVCSYLDIPTVFYRYSDLIKDNIGYEISPSERIARVLKVLDGTMYINSIAGSDLYENDYFEKNGIDLRFLKQNSPVYRQNSNCFVPNMSIVDVMMNNNKFDISSMVDTFSIIKKDL
jgi:hypothetical protein